MDLLPYQRRAHDLRSFGIVELADDDISEDAEYPMLIRVFTVLDYSAAELIAAAEMCCRDGFVDLVPDLILLYVTNFRYREFEDLSTLIPMLVGGSYTDWTSNIARAIKLMKTRMRDDEISRWIIHALNSSPSLRVCGYDILVEHIRPNDLLNDIASDGDVSHWMFFFLHMCLANARPMFARHRARIIHALFWASEQFPYERQEFMFVLFSGVQDDPMFFVELRDYGVLYNEFVGFMIDHFPTVSEDMRVFHHLTGDCDVFVDYVPSLFA
jgi:hypothetical protein